MRCPASICSDLRGDNFSLCIGYLCTENSKLSKILQDVYSNRSRNVVKSGWITTNDYCKYTILCGNSRYSPICFANPLSSL